MSLDFGTVRKYTDRGFGFLQSQFHGREVFFHIKKVQDSSAKETLDASAGGYTPDLQFWYSVAQTSKGLEASEIWTKLSDVPADLISPFAEKLIAKCNSTTRLGLDSKRVLDGVILEGHLTQEQLLTLLSTTTYRQNPISITQHLDGPHKRDAASLLDIQEKWGDVTQPMPSWLEPVTADLLGEEELKVLQSKREEAEQERRREEERKREEAKKLQEALVAKRATASLGQPVSSDLQATLAQRYGLSPVESKELYELLAFMAPMEFTTSKQLSNFIVNQQLGRQYPNISGIVRMEQDGHEWDFNGGFPPRIYAIVCDELELSNQGTRARPIRFTSFRELYQE